MSKFQKLFDSFHYSLNEEEFRKSFKDLEINISETDIEKLITYLTVKLPVYIRSKELNIEVENFKFIHKRIESGQSLSYIKINDVIVNELWNVKISQDELNPEGYKISASVKLHNCVQSKY